jgi:WhiB family redox-sensing transcriptional regulator
MLHEAQPWRKDSLCLEYPDVNFFPSTGESAKEAQAVCERCLVRVECRDYAMRRGITQGVWGGLTGPQRRRVPKAA